MAIASPVGTTKSAARQGTTSPSSARVAAATAQKTTQNTTQRVAQRPAATADRDRHRNTYFDVVVLLSVLMFTVLATGVGLLVLEQAAGWRL
jgi:hypothetical protein